jgi:hypothetical protein
LVITQLAVTVPADHHQVVAKVLAREMVPFQATGIPLAAEDALRVRPQAVDAVLFPVFGGACRLHRVSLLR